MSNDASSANADVSRKVEDRPVTWSDLLLLVAGATEDARETGEAFQDALWRRIVEEMDELRRA